jgi:hypothetical protein
MTDAWIWSILAQSALAWRTRGAIRLLHAWQVASGLCLVAIHAWMPQADFNWAMASWRTINAGVIAHACAGRFRFRLSACAVGTLVAVAAGSAAYFDRDLIQPYSVRWLLLAIPAAYWLGSAWPDRWLTAYAALVYAFSLAQAWVWFGSAELAAAQQWAQVALFGAWALAKTGKARLAPGPIPQEHRS